MMRYLLGFLVALALIIIAVVLIVNGINQKPVNIAKQLNSFASYASTGSQASLSIEGPITANQNHNKVIITVNASNVNLSITQGYNDRIINSQNFNNSENSYLAFLKSIFISGFTNKIKANGNYNSPVGLCPSGDNYIFSMTNNLSTVVNSWETSCVGSPHTFNGNLNSILQLFELQVPSYQNYVNNVNI